MKEKHIHQVSHPILAIRLFKITSFQIPRELDIRSLCNLSTEIQCKDCPTPMGETSAKEQESHCTWETHAQNPFNWPTKKKWRQFFAGSLVTLLVGLNSTAIATPGVDIANQFNVDIGNPNLDNTVWPITAWNTGAAFGPMVGIPILEAFGMRYGYLVRGTPTYSLTGSWKTWAKFVYLQITYALFFLFVIPQAVARSFATVIVTRVFTGVFGGVLMNCLACFVADMWLTDVERDLYITLFILIYVAGVTIGPTFGAIVAVLEWRW